MFAQHSLCIGAFNSSCLNGFLFIFRSEASDNPDSANRFFQWRSVRVLSPREYKSLPREASSSVRQAFADFLVMSRAKSYKFHMLQYPQRSEIETCRSKILKLKRNLAYMPASIWESRFEGEKLASEQARSSHFQSYGCWWKLPRFLRRECPVTRQCKFIKKHFVIGSPGSYARSHGIDAK